MDKAQRRVFIAVVRDLRQYADKRNDTLTTNRDSE